MSGISEDALCPAALLRARCVCADPLALLRLSLPIARDRSALRPSAGASLTRNDRQGLACRRRPSVSVAPCKGAVVGAA